MLDLSDEALLDYLFEHLEPNPDRDECPPRTVLMELAQRTRPLSDPWWDHLRTCSPCRIDVRKLGRALGIQAAPAGSVWAPRGWAAAVVLVVAVGLWMWMGTHVPGPVAVTGDLRPHALTRGDQPLSLAPPVVEWPRQRVRVTVLLPTASEPGSYEIALRTSDGRSLATGIGDANVRDFVTRLSADLDLRTVRSGLYDLAVRRTGEEWQLFPIRIE